MKNTFKKTMHKTILAISLSALTSASVFAACTADIDMGRKAIINLVMQDPTGTNSEVVNKSYIDSKTSLNSLRWSFFPHYQIVAGQNNTLWLDRNLGAKQVCTSSTDTKCAGSLFQWGRFADGHQCTRAAGDELGCNGISSTVTSTASSADKYAGGAWQGKFIATTSVNWLSTADNTLWQGVYGKNNVCPTGFRVPTETELDNERTSWTTNNAAGALNSSLKFGQTGYRVVANGNLSVISNNGFYWSSTLSGTKALEVYIGNATSMMQGHDRTYAFAVRCIKD